jgi:hypothetical protein
MTEANDIKQVVKEALYEFFKEDNAFLRKAVSEVMEEIALGKAMEAGDVGDYVDEKLIFEVLNKDN